jgi:histidinol-phosphate/aromatic aminotransferase/cobyric acid decarboxylase-like protein
LAGKYFGVNQSYICVGNGAAELIKSLMEKLTGKSGFVFPTFEEYPNRYDKKNIVEFIPDKKGFTYTAEDLINHFDSKDISNLLLINPDNPSGNFIDYNGICKLMDWCEKKGINLIVDESFLDFADSEGAKSLLDNDILKKYPHVLVVKSISKSYGVPGLRLGVIASSNTEIINFIKKDVSIWNINSFGEFFMQIIEKYRGDYLAGLREFFKERTWYVNQLKAINSIEVYDTQANYVMFRIKKKYTANKLAETLLADFNVFIKDLSPKRGFNGEYIRVAVRNREDNAKLIDALKELF